jgi:acyl-CoA synthetase (NDP forming)
MERLLRPKSVAIIGASSTPGSFGAGVLGNLDRYGFKGEVHLVNPNRDEIDGRRCLHSTADLPHGVDCAIIAIPQSGMREAVDGCAARGVGGAIIFTGGFAEAGAEGRALQDEIAATARAHGMLIEGPNCLGFVNNVDGVPLTFSVALPFPLGDRSGIGIVSQSGAMASVLRAALNVHEVPFSYAISTGNEAVTGLEDYVEFLIGDRSTRVMTLVVEQFRKPRRFLELAQRAREAGKAIVVLHPGRSAAARASAQTHTAAMSGDYQVMRSFITYAGAIVVDTIEEVIDVSEVLLRFPRPPCGGGAVLTESGIFKGLALDYCEQIDLDLPPLSATSAATISEFSPGLIQPSNPLDLTAQALAQPTLFTKALTTLIEDERFGWFVINAMCTNAALTHRRMHPVLDQLKADPPSKPVFFTMLGDDAELPQAIVRGFREIGLPFFRSPERALRALARVVHHANRDAAPRVASTNAVRRSMLPEGVIPEHIAKGLLADAGFPVPKGIFVQDLDTARRATAAIGFPVVLKAQSAALSHKSDAGGVVLGITDDTSLVAGWTKLHANIASAQPGLELDGVLVEAMTAKGLEIILGARNDKDWGPILIIGLGGIWAEALHDTRLLPADLEAAAIAAEFRKLRGAEILAGARGSAPFDVDAAAALAARLGAFIVAYPEIEEIDLNPVVIYPQGEGAIALDALIVARNYAAPGRLSRSTETAQS